MLARSTPGVWCVRHNTAWERKPQVSVCWLVMAPRTMAMCETRCVGHVKVSHWDPVIYLLLESGPAIDSGSSSALALLLKEMLVLGLLLILSNSHSAMQSHRDVAVDVELLAHRSSGKESSFSLPFHEPS